MSKMYYQNNNGDIVVVENGEWKKAKTLTKVVEEDIKKDSDTLFKTINGESIVGEGNIDISGGDGKVDDVKVNGTSVLENKVANIQLKTINNTDLQGSGDITIESGTTVEANPEVSGKEDTLTSIKIGDRGYIVSGGSSVTPNPEDFNPNEDEFLNSVKIGDTNYGVLGADLVAQHFMLDGVSTIWVDDLQSGSFDNLSCLLQLKLQPGDGENYPSWPEPDFPFPCLIAHYDKATDKEYTEIATASVSGGWDEKVEPIDANYDNVAWLDVYISSSKGHLSLYYEQPSKESGGSGGWSITENTLVWETGGSEQSVKGLDFGGKNVLTIKQVVLVNEEDEDEYTTYDATSRSRIVDCIPSYIVANGYNEPIITNIFPELAIDSKTGKALASITHVAILKGTISKPAEVHNTRYHINKMYHYNGLQNYPDNMLFITAVEGITKSIDDLALVIGYSSSENSGGGLNPEDPPSLEEL